MSELEFRSMPQLLYKEVGADGVPQLMLWSIPQLSENEVEVERCFNYLRNEGEEGNYINIVNNMYINTVSPSFSISGHI
jgi:hypothetical protein